MTTTHQNALTDEDRAAIRRFIEKHPAIYQRWLEPRQAREVRQAEILQRIRRTKS